MNLHVTFPHVKRLEKITIELEDADIASLKSGTGNPITFTKDGIEFSIHYIITKEKNEHREEER